MGCFNPFSSLVGRSMASISIMNETGWVLHQSHKEMQHLFVWLVANHFRFREGGGGRWGCIISSSLDPINTQHWACVCLLSWLPICSTTTLSFITKHDINIKHTRAHTWDVKSWWYDYFMMLIKKEEEANSAAASLIANRSIAQAADHDPMCVSQQRTSGTRTHM